MKHLDTIGIGFFILILGGVAYWAYVESSWTTCLTLIISLFFFIYIKKNRDTPSAPEARAVFEQIENKKKEYLSVIGGIREIKEPVWLAGKISKASPKLQGIVGEIKNNIARNLNEEVGDTFYKKSLKATFSKAAKQDLKEMGHTACENLIDLPQFKRKLNALMSAEEQAMVEDMNKLIRERSSRAEAMNPGTLFHLEQLQGKPERWRKIVGGNEEFKQVLEFSKDPMVVGGTLSTVIGVEMLHILQEYGGEAALDFAMHTIMISPLADVATEMIGEWIVEEFGEAALTEVAQIIGEVLTGIGVVLLPFRIIRYGMKAKRIFIDKEPLQKIRQSIKDSLDNALESLQNQGNNAFGNAMRLQFNYQLEGLNKLEGRLSDWIEQAEIEQNRLRKHF